MGSMDVGRRPQHQVFPLYRNTKETIVLDYYTSIFQSDMPSTFATVEEALEPKVTPEMNAVLLSEFHHDEVRDALQQMHPLKSPGPDCMSPVFYQKFWNIL